ncbi:MAG: tetratricopeptide repeat protein [Gammaproteobacteria bacterium]|nr:tetratricopeptide repeat protein [Gammaproteobacteria bacterium]
MDLFDKIHELLRHGMRNEALTRIYSTEDDSLKPPYDIDPNHAWYIVGDILFKASNFEKSALAFERSCSYRSDDMESLMALANALTECEKPDLAEQALLKALTLDPTNDSLLYNLGNALFDQDKYVSAIESYSKISDSDVELKEITLKNIELAKEKIKPASL